MKDQFQRNIDYLRVSVTDRCNLRCKYCMPNGVCPVTHEEVLRYDEILRLARLFAKLGITHVRVTGGEPLVRKDVVELVAGLKQTEGIRTVSMTTNGTLLPKFGEALQKAGLDSVNISLDTTDEDLAAAITGQSGVVALVDESVALMQRLNIPVKLNAVLLKETEASMANVARFAERGVPVRFIELMPIGSGAGMAGLSSAEALSALRRLTPTCTRPKSTWALARPAILKARGSRPPSGSSTPSATVSARAATACASPARACSSPACASTRGARSRRCCAAARTTKRCCLPCGPAFTKSPCSTALTRPRA